MTKREKPWERGWFHSRTKFDKFPVRTCCSISLHGDIHHHEPRIHLHFGGIDQQKNLVTFGWIWHQDGRRFIVFKFPRD
jgi:hypothetical protein